MTRAQRVRGRNALFVIGIIFEIIGFLAFFRLVEGSTIGIDIFLVTSISGLTFLINGMTEMFAEDRHDELLHQP